MWTESSSVNSVKNLVNISCYNFRYIKCFLRVTFWCARYSLTAHIVFNLRVQNVAPKRAFSRPDFKAKFAKCSIRDVFETTNFFDTKIQQMFPVMKHID